MKKSNKLLNLITILSVFLFVLFLVSLTREEVGESDFQFPWTTGEIASYDPQDGTIIFLKLEPYHDSHNLNDKISMHMVWKIRPGGLMFMTRDLSRIEIMYKPEGYYKGMPYIELLGTRAISK